LKKIRLGITGLALIAFLGVELGAGQAYANKVDCDKVMAEVGAGKKASDIAKDLSISTSSVYRCKKKAKAAASPAAGTSPMAAASPAGSMKAKRHKKSTSGGSASPAAAASPGT
jgi:hypothetical protein